VRILMGSANVPTAGTAVQVSSDSVGRVVEFLFRVRPGNTGNVNMYLGTSSTLSSVGGWSLSSATSFPISGDFFTVPAGKGLRPTDFWVNSSGSTTNRMDWSLVVEP